MSGRRARGALLVAALTIAAAPARGQFALPTDFVDEAVIGGFAEPVGMAMLPDGRLFVIERATARVRLLVQGALAAIDPVVTVPGVDASYGEEGLLGIAVDPGWPARPYLYLQYTVTGEPIHRIARFTAAGDLAFTGNGALTIDPATRYDVLIAPHEAEFHNGGTLRFGPDGMLYSSLGDYTLCGAQTLGDLRGKILRLDVSGLPPGPGGPAPRALITPADNPFAAHPQPDARLVWQWGLRNPFRFALDPATGEMTIGDVGGDQREEVNHAPTPGLNFEWIIYEGDVPGPLSCPNVDSTAFTGPIYTYDHSEGAAVIGGVIYRRPPGAPGPFPPAYEGNIFFSDFYGNWIRRLKRSGNTWSLAPAPGQPNATDWAVGPYFISDWLVAHDGTLWYCAMLGPSGVGPGFIRRIRYGGVVSAPPPPAAGPEFHPPHPNPARAGVTLEFMLAKPGTVALSIHDLAGRRVRSLIAATPHPAGPRRLQWDGRDARGEALPAGIYRARLTVAGGTLERRVVLVR
ncbi:MAG TPA: PQQ-dependent sugar dehydrogenase [Candidatus Eisenbacteria bacterium]|nr:PQQ-dependent sugar dehydrogenase [Candidatus Eisenbacteria bacterium]